MSNINYDLYLERLKNEYSKKSNSDNVELDDAARRRVSLLEALEKRKSDENTLIGTNTPLQTSLEQRNQQQKDVSQIAEENKIAWSEEYDKESLNWWEQVGAWINQAKNTIAETFVKMGTESLIDAGALVGAMFAENVLGDKNASQNIQDFIKMDLTGDLMFNQEWYRQADKVASGTFIFGDKASKYSYNDAATQDWVKNLSQGIGSSLGFAALTSIPYVGWGLAATSVGGSSAEEALKEGANPEQAFVYGLGSAAVESITELTVGKILNLIGKGGGSMLSKITGKQVEGKLANDIVGGIGKSYGKSIALNLIKNFNEEGMEEVVSDLVNPILKMIYKECDEDDFFGKYGQLFEEQGGWQGLLESYMYGGLSAGVMEGVNLGARVGRYQSIKAVQFENSITQVVEINAELKEEIEKNDYTKYPNLEDNPKIKRLLQQKQFIQDKIGKDFKEWFDTIKADFDETINRQGYAEGALARKVGLIQAGEVAVNTGTKELTQEIGKEIVEGVGYQYGDSTTLEDKNLQNRNFTDFDTKTIYVNGKQNFSDYIKSLVHEVEHATNKEMSKTSLKSLTQSIIESMTDTAYKEELNSQIKLQANNFFKTDEGKKWLKDNKLTLEEYKRLSAEEKAKINEKLSVEKKAWFDEEIAAEHLIDSFKSLKEFKKVIANVDARGLRKIITALRKAFGNKKDKPKNYDEIIRLLEEGIKENRKQVAEPEKITKTNVKFRETKDSEGNTLTENQIKFFANSKIRNEEGKLIKVYHGTEADFTVFDKTKGRSFADIQGMFFSPWELDSRGYGRNVRAFYLNITNPADYKTALRALDKFKGQNNMGIKAREYLESLGYDGVNFDNEEYIAFNPEQIKLTTNENPTIDKDIRYREVDSEGIELSKKQIEFFKDSKVRDDNGSLKVMYHGTNKNFTIFNTELDGAYFTENKEYARQYTRNNENENIYKVYLNIKRPFDTREEESRKLFYDKFYKKMGNGVDLTSKGLPDWTDGADLVEFVKQYGYDGIILDEGGVPLPNGKVRDRGISYIALSPNQIKNVDNTNPTESQDIRFRETTDPFDLENEENSKEYERYNLNDENNIKINEILERAFDVEDDVTTNDLKEVFKDLIQNNINVEIEEIRQLVKSENPDKQKAANLRYKLINNIRTLIDNVDNVEVYNEQLAKSLKKASNQAITAYKTYASKLNRIIGKTKAIEVENTITAVDEVEQKNRIEAKIEREFDRSVVKQALINAGINADEIEQTVKRTANSFNDIYGQINDRPNPTRDSTIKKRYESLVIPYDNLVKTYKERLNQTDLSAVNKRKALDFFIDDLLGGTRNRQSREEKIERVRTQYGSIGMTAEESVRQAQETIAPVTEPQVVERERVRFINNARKIAMPEMAGIKAQADLRLDGKVYTLKSVTKLIKFVETTLNTEQLLRNKGFLFDFEGTTRELKATEIAMILNEYNNSKYVKRNPINYSNLTNAQKVDKITKILVDGLIFDYNPNDSVTNDRLRDYITAGDRLAVTIEEFIRAEVKTLVDNEGNVSKITRILLGQTAYFREQIAQLRNKVSELSEKIVDLKEKLREAKDNKKLAEKLQKQLEKLNETLEKRKAEIKEYRQQLRTANRKITNLENKNARLEENLEYYKNKNIELYTDEHGIKKISVDDIRTLTELGRNLNENFKMSSYLTNQISNAIASGKIDNAVNLYLNALMNSDYIDGDVLLPYSELVAMQEVIYGDEYIDNGESRDVFQQDMEEIRKGITDIFNGAKISTKQKLLDRLSKLYAYNEAIRLKLRETRTDLAIYRSAASASDTAKRIYAKLYIKNEQGKTGKSGNRYGGLNTDYVDMVRKFTKGTETTLGLNQLNAKRIANLEFKPALKEFYNRYQQLSKQGVVNNLMSEQLENYILYLLDDTSTVNGGYISTFKKVLNGISRLVENEIKGRQVKLGKLQGSYAEVSQIIQDENWNTDDSKLEKFDFIQSFITPRAVIEKLARFNKNAGLYQIYNELFEAEMKKESAILELREPFTEFDKNKESKKFYKSLRNEVEIKYGDKSIKGEKGQLLSLYEAFKREQSLSHITNRLGGIEINGKKVMFENFAELQQLITNIETEFKLNDENSIDTKFIKAVESFFRIARNLKMDVDMQRWGFTNVEEGFYFPISISDLDAQVKISSEGFFSVTMPGAANYSFNQNTTGSMGAIKLKNVYDIIQSHLNQMGTYAGYGVAADSISKIWNYKLEQGKTVAQAVKSRFTADTAPKIDRYLATLLTDVQSVGGRTKSNVDTIFEKIISKLRGNVATVALGANPKVMLSQTASIPAAMRYIKARYLVQALKSGFGVGIGNGSLPPKPDMFIYRQQTNQIAQAETQGAIENTKNILSKGINAFDTYAINVIWKAALLQTRYEDGSWNIERATKLAQKTVFNTQPNYFALGRSEFLRSKSDFVKLFTMFQSQAQQNLSMAYSAIERLVYKKKHHIPITRDDWQEVISSFLALFIQGLVYTGMGELFKHLVNNDWEDMTPGDTAVDFSVSFFNDNIMGMIPILNNIELDLSQKYKVNFERLGSGWLDTFTDMIEGLMDGSISAKDFTSGISYVTGIPFTNMYKWTKALLQYVPGAEDYVAGFDATYRGKKITSSYVKKAGTKALTRTYYRNFTKKYVKIDNATMTKLYNLYSKGYTDVILKDVPETYSENGVVKNINSKEFLETYSKVGTALDQIVKSSQFNTLDDELQAEVLTKLINSYYNASKKAITGDKMNTLEMIAYFGKIVDAKTISAIVQASKITKDDKNDRKQAITKYINSLRMTRENKYFIYAVLGYKTDVKLYQNYLRNIKLNRAEINMLSNA